MNKLISILILSALLHFSCTKDDADPFALPPGAYDCRGLWEQNPEGPVGNLSYTFNGVESVGLAESRVTTEGIVLFEMKVYREDCFSTAGFGIVNVDLNSKDTVRSFNCFRTTCEINSDCRLESRHFATFEILDHDNPLAYYSTKPDNDSFYYVLTDVNFDGGYARGSFGGVLYLDPTCASFIGYPDSILLNEGHFIVPI